MRMMLELIKLACEILSALYPIYKDWRESRQKKKADQSGNSDQQES